MNLSKDLDKNFTALKKVLVSDDVEFLSTKAGNKTAVLVFARDLIDKHLLGELVLKPLGTLKTFSKRSIEKVFFSPEKKLVNSVSQTLDEVAGGNAVLLIDGLAEGISFGLKKFEIRAITEPPTSTVIKGPREGFVESLPVNVSLIRRRIKSPDLRFENMVVGKYSKTAVSLCYIHTITDQGLVKKLKKRLSCIDVDAVLDSSYIAKFLGEHSTSLFKQVGNTEKPDILSAKILEGRVAILVDGSPIVLTVPYLLIEDFQSPSDYYNSPYTATVARIIRVASVMLSILLPAFFVSAQLFHLQFIPLSFLLTIVNSIKGIPLSPSFEMFFTLLIFEILNEASVRMPKYVGMAVSIVGGLVLGETAVSAGIISAPALMIIALSGICLYTVPELAQNFSVLRLCFLIVGGSVGSYGILVGLAILLIYLVSFENYQTPLLAPFSPLVKSDLKDGLFKGFLTEQIKRPYSLKNVNKRRMTKNKGDENAPTING